MEINYEFRKGILFIRLNGIFNKNTGKNFNNKINKFIYKYGIKYFVINLEEVSFIDDDGIRLLRKQYKEIIGNKAKLIICNYQNTFYKDIIERRFDNCYKINNEIEAFKLISI